MKKLGRTKKPTQNKPIREVFEKRFLNHVKRAARRKNLKFTLTISTVVSLMYQNCFYCGAKPSNRMRMLNRKRYHNFTLVYSGLDRKDNSRGYTEDNVVPCCLRCNRIKSDIFSFEEMVALAEFLQQLAQKQQAPEIEARLVTILRKKLNTAL